MKQATLYEKLPESRVRCNLCAHRCVIKDGKKGICQVRENREGMLYTLVYGRTIAQHVDPVEKKPLFHFYPGSTAYSFTTARGSQQTQPQVVQLLGGTPKPWGNTNACRGTSCLATELML